jgi:histone-lysine N-methyltransferase SETMAR
VYGDNAMSAGMVRKWVRMFNEGRENVHDEARSGRPSLVNEDLVRKFNERVRDERRFTISDLSLHFPQISRTVLYDIVSSHLGYRKVCARWVPKMLTEEHKKQRVACAVTFLMRYHQERDDMLSHIVTGDETWVY